MNDLNKYMNTCGYNSSVKLFSKLRLLKVLFPKYPAFILGPNITLPEDELNSPTIKRNKVDFPAPFTPTTASFSCLLIIDEKFFPEQ